MILNQGKQWVVAVLLCVQRVNLQMPMPMFMPPMPPIMPPMIPPMYFPPPPPPPMPMPIPMPAPSPIAFQIVQIQEPKKSSTAEKNEKEEKTIGIAIPMGFPAPLQFAMPQPLPPAFPAPPMPVPDSEIPLVRSQPMDSQPSYQILPAHHVHSRPRIWRDKNYDHAEFQDYSSEIAYKKNNKRKRPGRRYKKPLFRKTFDSDIDDFAKPVLSYISNDGDIKIEKRLSDDEATELMADERLEQKVQVMAEEDSDNRQSIKVISSVENKLTNTGNTDNKSEKSGNHRRRQVLLKSGSMQHMLGEGKKELVFKPPIDKKISNLSVSFQIS